MFQRTDGSASQRAGESLPLRIGAGGRACIGSVIAIAVAFTPPVAGQVRQQFDLRVPMRDGVELSANLWTPPGVGPFAVVLVRTPYIKAAEGYATMGREYAERGYALLVQDARGRGDSDGEFDFFFADAKDGYDTIEWIAQQAWSNGRVGMVGGSYLATVQWLAAREQPQALECMVPQAPGGDYFNELPYIGGAFLMQWALNWINGTSGRTAQGPILAATDWERVYQHRPLLTMDEALGRRMPLYRDFLRHSTEDAYWKRILFTAEDFRSIDVPALAFTGWFDSDQPGTMRYWYGMQQHSPARDRQHIIIGPWTHGGAIGGGSITLGEFEFTGESIVDVDSLHLEYFDSCLKGASRTFEFPRARIYVTGSNRWHDFDAYPPRAMEPQSFYLTSAGAANTLLGDGRLTRASADAPPDRYTYNPERPVPASTGGYGVDQRAIQRRDDVLVYTSDVLTEPLDVIGPVEVVLHAASDARDTDFTAKLTDVYPDGRALKLGWWDIAAIRARYRNGFDQEELLAPGQVEEYRIRLGHMGHTFLPGHRLRIEISSSAFPFLNPNQNTGNPVATDTVWKVANQTIYHDRARPSRLVLPVMPTPVP